MPAEIGQVESQGETGLEEVLSVFHVIRLLLDNDRRHAYLQGQRWSRICRSKSSLKYFRALWSGSMAPGARAQKVRPSHSSLVCKASRWRSFGCPRPSSRAWRICAVQGRPSRQGVHQPHDSWAKKCSRLCTMPTGQVWSSRTIIVPVPSRLPAFCTESKSIFTSRCSSTKKSVEAPPGSKPRNLAPSRM